MPFWETVLGHELAHILCRSLPQLADSMARQQFTMVVKNYTAESLKATIDIETKKPGVKLDQSICTGEKEILLIFSKPQD